MSIIRLIGSKLVVASTFVTLSLTLHAAPEFTALDRPALRVTSPERQVMLSAAQVGSRIVAVGERGLVALSDDGGTSWRQARYVPVSATLTAVYFVDAKLGWAVGHGAVVLHTKDGGETWVRQAEGRALASAAFDAAETMIRRQSDNPKAIRELNAAKLLVQDGADKPLLDVYFIDAHHGWIVGAYNLFFETRDGGLTWISIASRLENPKGLHLNAIRAHGKKVFIVGEQGQMHRSTDGGETFETVSSPYKGSLFTLSLTSAGEVVTAGLKGNAFSSADFGKNWQRIEGLAPVSVFGSAVLANGSVLLANQGGQVFLGGLNEPLKQVPMPASSALASMLVLKDGGLLILGLGGVMRVPGELSLNKASK